jgi:hypothetical protein
MMRRPVRQRGQVLLIVLGSLLFGAGTATGIFTTGKSLESIRKDVKSLRLDASRQDRVYAVLDRWEAISGPAVEDFDAYGESLLNLMRQQTATREDFDLLLEGQREKLQSAEEQVLPLRDELRAAVTQDEWNQLFR